MKILTFFIGYTLLFSLNSCSQDFKKVSDSDVNNEEMLLAQNFATSYFTKLKNGEFYQFQDEAIDQLKFQLTEETQKSIYKQLKDKFGDFKDLEYSETWSQGNNNSIRIFRFKSDFVKSKKKIEVRVVLNDSNKIAGFWIKPWSDMLK